jgi:hypothetical protein
MSKRMFTEEQVEELRKSPHVTACSEKSITFSKAFKVNAVRLHREEYLTPSEIFKQSGLDIKVITKERRKACLMRWSRSYRMRGLEGLSDARGRNGFKKKLEILDLTDADKIKKMEAEIAYLKAENDFLAKLRAKRAE